jgi:hypothetical protein
MMCPVCNGSGRVRKRFLLFFTRRARCANCLGTGEFPPPLVEQARSAPGFIRDDDPLDRHRSIGTSSRDREDTFEVGSGGRSGGGGASASWGDSSEKDAPVIADPFGSDSSDVSNAIGADAADSNASESGSSEVDSDSGTAY